MNRFGISHALLKKYLKGLGVLSILFSIALVVYLVRQLDILNNPNALAHTIKDHVVIGSIGFFAWFFRPTNYPSGNSYHSWWGYHSRRFSRFWTCIRIFTQCHRDLYWFITII